ncbi:outer membrane beta-barrel protein [Polymorphobacter fuscus]|uniref:Outer membrane beta-barrel protein n=1 Tax=Sandarakinorhabdus fusca TaxID=1439888 RepID=A0A7C9GXF4_9SPHN|nr:outer membrane beta-barrel protein [Polymorphobacter fuscus]KAB7647917.1 outer membrane beta-barrel protein [Polymorphobacter fuscus]MQT17234.1 outer membrane beta-barrel protein [Polymorphobacter fuscus]NJC08772.1 hypothetical protein [Polymorphobacter fuscus]
MTTGRIWRARRLHRVTLAAIALAGWGLPSAAVAQSVPPGQGVGDRPRPGFDPIGVDVGGFQLYPSLQADVRATDNFRASNSNRQGDIYLVATPAARLTSNWSRHALSAQTFFSRSFHDRLKTEDVSQYGVSALGTLDISREARISINAGADRKTEPRDSLASFQGTPSPVSYDIYRVGISGAQAFNRFILNASAGVEKRAFNDVAAADGTIIDQSFRNVRTVTASASAQMELRSGVSALVSGQFDDSHYEAQLAPGQLRRDSSGYTVLAGVSLELSTLVFGQLQVGIINRSYRDSRLRDVTGPSYRANLLWNVTPLTSLRLTGARTVEDAASTIFAGNTRSDVGLAVDHELYRYVIVSADSSYSRFSANGVGAKGSEFQIGAGARYLFGRRWSVSGRIRYAQRRSDDQRLRYHATIGMVSAQLAF